MDRALPITWLSAVALAWGCAQRDQSSGDESARHEPSPDSAYNPKRMFERVVIGRCAGDGFTFDPAEVSQLGDPLRGMRDGPAGAAKSPLPPIRIGAPSIAGPLDRRAAAEALARYSRSLRLCAARFLSRSKLSLPHSLTLDLSLKPNGTVGAARAPGAPGRLGECMARVAEKMRFAAAPRSSRLRVSCTLLGAGSRDYPANALRNGLLGARAMLRACVTSSKASGRAVARVTIGQTGDLEVELAAIRGENLDPGLGQCAEAALAKQIVQAPGPAGPITMRCPLALGRVAVKAPPVISIRRGQVRIGDEAAKPKQLLAAIEAAARKGSKYVVLRADFDTPYRELAPAAVAAQRRFALVFERDVAGAWMATHIPDLPQVLVPRSRLGVDRVSLLLEEGGDFVVRAGREAPPVRVTVTRPGHFVELFESLQKARRSPAMASRLDLGIAAAPKVTYLQLGQAIIMAKRAGFIDIELLPPAGRGGHH